MADIDTTNNEPGFADLLELDLDRPASKAAVAPVSYDARPLDMIDDVKHPKCVECGAEGAVNDDGVCRGCYEDKAHAAQVPTSANPEQDFAGVIAESAANAGTVSGGSLAEGARRYVGFNSAEGYIQALANGVKAETARQYKDLLVQSYGYTREAVEALPTNLIAESALPVGQGIVHEGDTDAAVAAIKARSAAIKAAKARKANNDGQLTIVPDEQPAKVRLTHGNVVAGAVAEGNGILTHWTGADELTRGKLVELATAAELPDSWLPKAKSAETQAHLAVTTVARELKLDAKREKKTHKDAGAAYDTRWRITDASTAGNDAGQSAGSITLVVTLNEGELTFAGDEDIATKVTAAYKDLTDREVLQAGHVTTWLGGILRDRLGGVKYGGCWYVPVATRPAAEKIINAFAPAWGTDWMNPPTPIATSEQLARGIANGLAAEVDNTLRELAKDGSKCKGGKVGETAAITYLRRFKDHGAKALAFGHLLGEKLVKEVKTKIATATAQLDGLIDDGMGTVKRFELIWEELERDLLKEETKHAEAAS